MAAGGARLAAAARLARHAAAGGRASRGGIPGGVGGRGGGLGNRCAISLPGGCVLPRTGGRGRVGGGGGGGCGGGGGGCAVAGVGAVAAATVGGVRHSAAGATHPPRPVNERCLEYRPGSPEVAVRFAGGYLWATCLGGGCVLKGGGRWAGGCAAVLVGADRTGWGTRPRASPCVTTAAAATE